jgi:3-hydroxybutyryl-CoA dehydrogenase
MTTTPERVFIIGAGLMGGGIAQVCAQRGLQVTLCDLSQEILEQAKKTIAWSAGKLIEKGKVEGALSQVMERITVTVDRAPVAEVDLVIEAVFEDLALKREVLADLDACAPDHALFASNTSAIPITELAASTRRPEQVLGLHFFSPVPMMQAVEVVRGIATSDETFAAGQELVRRLGKEPIPVHRDVPGFLLNRLNLPSSIEAMRLVEQGVGTVEDIDRGVKLAFGRRMGIFETGDMVGLDVTHGALMALYEETRDPRWYPPLILRRKVKAGHLGRKAGRGWYLYDDEGKRLGPAQ